VKVKNVGTLDSDSKDVLLHYFRRIYSGIDSPGRAGLTPRPGEADLYGVGAALNTYPAPVPTASHMPTTTSAAGFSSSSAVSGYPPATSTVYGGASDFGVRGEPSGYYPQAFQHETSSISYPLQPNTHGMDSSLYAGPSSYVGPSMRSQTQYSSTTMAASSHGLTYTSEGMMDTSRRASDTYYPDSPRDGYYDSQRRSPLPPANPDYSSSGYYGDRPSDYHPPSAGGDFYSQSSSEFAQPAEGYSAPGGYSLRPQYSEPAPHSDTLYEDDIDLGNLDTARQEARKRKESRPDRRRR
jgi:hypothetical protein